MSLRTKSIDELIQLACNTRSLDEMLFLQKNTSMNVRRALAKNINLHEKVLEKLRFDPVANVSYMASLHPKMKNKREFGKLRPCVSCEKDERTIDCIGCVKVVEYSF